MDKNGKSRHSVWLSDDVWQEVDAFYKLDNCPSVTMAHPEELTLSEVLRQRKNKQ